jgi:hypothetical protein
VSGTTPRVRSARCERKPCPFTAARRGIQEEATLLEPFMIAAGFAGGDAACVYNWPTSGIWINGLSAEVTSLRAKAQQLENCIRGR